MRFLAIGLIALGASAAAGQRPPLQAIPVDLGVPIAPSAVRAEGSTHLVYELHISNLGRQELALQQLDVLTTNGAIVRSYADSALQQVLARPGVQVDDRRIIGPGLRAVVFVDVATPDASLQPKVLLHRLTFRPVTPPNADTQTVVQGAEVRPRNPSGSLGAPVEGSGWVALNGLSNSSSHRRTLLTLNGKARISQRFAIDWSKVGDDGQVFHGDPANNANWAPYGQRVLAVADGVVVDIQDGIPENDPTSSVRAVPISLKTAGGNYIILDIGPGRFAFYAHLQPRSICVAVGQRVRRGQAIARVGNSGQADAPHLHIQIMDQPSLLASEGLPIAFDNFELLGHVQSLKSLADGSGWRPNTAAQTRRREMPVENAVVSFGKVANTSSCASR